MAPDDDAAGKRMGRGAGLSHGMEDAPPAHEGVTKHAALKSDTAADLPEMRRNALRVRKGSDIDDNHVSVSAVTSPRTSGMARRGRRKVRAAGRWCALSIGQRHTGGPRSPIG